MPSSADPRTPCISTPAPRLLITRHKTELVRNLDGDNLEREKGALSERERNPKKQEKTEKLKKSGKYCPIPRYLNGEVSCGARWQADKTQRDFLLPGTPPPIPSQQPHRRLPLCCRFLSFPHLLRFSGVLAPDLSLMPRATRI
jgi:hypothetical protein